MTSARTTARKALPFVCLVLFGLPGTGCGDDDESGAGSGGSAGRMGGASGKLSSGGGAGKSAGGSANGGHAGSANNGGSPNGGKSSGGASPGGASTGDGGANANGGGNTVEGGSGGEISGGAGGVAPAGGSGGARDELRQCAESCSVDSDCFTDPSTPDNFVCSPATHRCVYHACDGDQDCGLLGNVWTKKCTSDSACATSETCVDVKGSGRCVKRYDGQPCPSDRESVSWKHLGGGPDVEVCADTSFHCIDNVCVRPCTTTSCRNGTACNSVSGQCDLCASDVGCTLLNRPPHCNTATQRCECHDSSECPGNQNADVCVNGSCGCSDASSCTRKNGNNAVLVCE